MEGFQLYFDASTGLYRYTDDAEEDSGVEDLPFSFYNPTDLYTSPDILTQTSTCNDADDEDLTYVDDVRDGDYMPNKSYASKKGKRPYRRRQYNGNTCLSQLMTPEKQRHKLYTVGDLSMENQIRHYARKDRTPDTIQKMMERHRESERVRHHTLNESMKDVCLRVPGYDPDVKETKVIQMQRIIAYECFLENTLNDLGEKLGANAKSLKINTNFITDAMKSTPIEDFYQPSNYKTSDIEEEEGIVIKTEVIDDEYNTATGSRYKVARKQSNNRHLHKYRQEKISSPTVDSTTSDFIQVMPVSPTSVMPGYQFIMNGHFPSQCFIPIDHTTQNMPSSQESGIKMEETQSTCYDDDNHFHEDIGTFMEHGICVEPEHLKTVTPSFMKEEVNSISTTYNDPDQYHTFDLSSPIRQHGKVFLQSPKSTSVWSKQNRSCFLGKADTPMGKEMQSVSPENVLETKPKLSSEGDHLSTQHMSTGMTVNMCSEGTDVMQLTANQIIQATQNSNEIQQMYDPQGRQFSTYKVFSGISRENGCIKVQHIYIPKFENGALKLDCMDSSGKNKRKRYTPLRSADETSQTYLESEEEEEEEEEECDGMSSLCGETTDTDIEDHEFEMSESSSQPQPQPLPIGGPFPYGFPQNWGYPAPAPCRGQGKKVKYAKPLVDHRKSTWMNGFMMFSKINRPKFTGENPGVHTSQIQKLMGEAWRKLTMDEKQPYKDQAKEWCERMKNAGANANNTAAQTDTNAKPGETNKETDKAKTDSTPSPASSAAKTTDQKETDSATKTENTDTKSDTTEKVNGTPPTENGPQE